MEVKFIGSLSEITAEMEEFLSGAGSETPAATGTAKKKTTGTTKKKELEKITADTIREAMLACDDKDGKKKLLADYGASKISDLDEDNYEEFLEKLKAL